MYWAFSRGEHWATKYQPRAGLFGRAAAATGYSAGLVDLFTPLSRGRINVNTASATVLEAIGVSAIAAEAIVGARNGADDGTGLQGPYRSVGEVRRVPEVDLPTAGFVSQFCDVRSFTFKVTVDAEANGYHRQFTAVLGRTSPKDIQILSFYWKQSGESGKSSTPSPGYLSGAVSAVAVQFNHGA